MTQTEMQETEGAWFSIPIRIGLQFLGRGGGGRICGVICRTGTSRNSGYGIRMDYAPNPSPTRLHFHAGRLSSGGSWGGIGLGTRRGGATDLGYLHTGLPPSVPQEVIHAAGRS